MTNIRTPICQIIVLILGEVFRSGAIKVNPSNGVFWRINLNILSTSNGVVFLSISIVGLYRLISIFHSFKNGWLMKIFEVTSGHFDPSDRLRGVHLRDIHSGLLTGELGKVDTIIDTGFTVNIGNMSFDCEFRSIQVLCHIRYS